MPARRRSAASMPAHAGTRDDAASLKSSLCLVLAALVGLFLCSVATAEGSAAKVVVDLRDLDPNNPDDAGVIYDRIKHAAERVCRRSSDRDLALTPERWACVRGTIAKAVASVRSPALSRAAIPTGN